MSAQPDPFLAAAREILDLTIADVRACIADASAETLNWRPAGDKTNSIAALAVHVMHSTRSWLAVATGAALPQRDRPSEFLSTASDTSELERFIDSMADDCRALLERAAPADWRVMRATHVRPNSDAPREVPAAWALLHAIEHLREHTGQMLLTRQLSDGRSGA